ncbi:radical SAM protein [Streptomyces morookaense]|uniref:radical SAM/SPASM domain-containing protein n=1 Tax=Streptomyces morookaense TaxID=1970 RepID=UPI0033F81C06
MVTAALPAEQTSTQFLWLDLTRKCQLACTHCYNASGPDGAHGTMTREDWTSLLDQAVGCGVSAVQFIGGEPTMHPDFAQLVDHAVTVGLRVEVYSNLVHVSPSHWPLFQREGVSLATSYYSNEAGEHDEVTRRPSHARTRANIVKAIELGVPIRVGIVGDTERIIAAAKADLESIGVSQIGIDRIREFGRAACGQNPDGANLCGGCGDGRASIDPSGTVSPCVFSTWMGVGNVREDSLTSILNGPALSDAVDSLREVWGWGKDKGKGGGSGGGGQRKPCGPDCVPKNPCDPRTDSDACRPGTPTTCHPRV